jgi:nicotinate-nucleotide adenylyltransferase
MKVGIFGGTFDPIHMGHLLLAETARETLALSRILFAPAGDSPLKQSMAKTPAPLRQAMVELAIAGNPCFELSLVDLQRPGPHYSVDTVRLLREKLQLPADAFYFIMGGDALADLPKWHQAAELITLCRLAVSHRPGYRPDLTLLAQKLPGLQDQLDWIEMPPLGLQASTIRKRVYSGQSIRYQVLDAVREYIDTNGLYCYYEGI